jgi:phage terminase small subunit
MKKKLTSKEESFSQAYILHKNDSIEGYRHSEYSQNLKPENMSAEAYKLLQKPHIAHRIKELQAKSSAIAEKKFTITVEQRLEWLKTITEAGIATYVDSAGANRRESLTAARGAIETMNTMLGITDSKDKKIEPIKIGIVDAS